MKEHVYDIYRNKKLTAKFGIIGSIGFVCNYLVLKLGVSWGLNRIIAEALAALVALQVTFFLHDRWTYRIDKTVHKYHLSLKKRYTAYLMSNSLGSLMTVVFFGIFSIFLGHFLALVLAAAVGLLWNFVINKSIIWHHKPNED